MYRAVKIILTYLERDTHEDNHMRADYGRCTDRAALAVHYTQCSDDCGHSTRTSR